MIEDLKQCSMCRKMLPRDVEHFHRHRTTRDKLKSSCKTCTGLKYQKYQPVVKCKFKRRRGNVDIEFAKEMWNRFQKLGISQSELGRQLGISANAPSLIFTGLRGLSLGLALLIAKKLDMDLNRFKKFIK